LQAEDLCSAMADGVDHASQAARVHDAVVQSIEVLPAAPRTFDL
jgi:hypothetical protein